MFLAQIVLPDSAATHAAAVGIGSSFAGWISNQFPGLTDNTKAMLAVLIGSLFGLLAAKVWHAANVMVHSNATTQAQESLQKFWAKWGRWISTLLGALVTGYTTKNMVAALIPVLATMPSAMFGGFSSTLTNQKSSSVSHARFGVLLLVVGLIVMAVPAKAAGVLSAPTDCGGNKMPLWSVHRAVFSASAGESWVGMKATDHPVAYVRAGGAYQWSTVIQTGLYLKRNAVPASTFRPEVEVKLVFAP